MKVIATKKGFHGALREVGDEFEVEDGLEASWFVPAEDIGKAHVGRPKAKADVKADAKADVKEIKAHSPRPDTGKSEDDDLV